MRPQGGDADPQPAAAQHLPAQGERGLAPLPARTAPAARQLVLHDLDGRQRRQIDDLARPPQMHPAQRVAAVGAVRQRVLHALRRLLTRPSVVVLAGPLGTRLGRPHRRVGLDNAGRRRLLGRQVGDLRLQRGNAAQRRLQLGRQPGILGHDRRVLLVGYHALSLAHWSSLNIYCAPCARARSCIVPTLNIRHCTMVL
jgi:hypothetical protein